MIREELGEAMIKVYYIKFLSIKNIEIKIEAFYCEL